MGKRKWRIVKSVPVSASTIIEPGTFLGGFPYLNGGTHVKYCCSKCWHQWDDPDEMPSGLPANIACEITCPRCQRDVVLLWAGSDEYKRKRLAEPASEVQRSRKIVPKTLSGGLFDSGPDSTRLGSKDSVGR